MFKEFEEIIDVEYLGEVETLDLEIDSDFHNFYANEICVSNSHCVSYSYIAAQTLFLKHYYPTEFYTALLNHPKSNNDKDEEQRWLATSIASAMSKGIIIKPPSRKSGWNWTMTGEREISMGFSGINGLGEKAYEEMITLVKADKSTLESITISKFFSLPFSTFNKKAFEVCVKAGVFDDWSSSRQHLLELKAKKSKKRNPNQMVLFDLDSEEFNITLSTNQYPPTDEKQKRKDFIEVCNFDLWRIEELSKIKDELAEKAGRMIESILNFSKNDFYFFFIDSIQETLSEKGKPYLVLKVGDGISHTSLRVFPSRTPTKDDLFDIVKNNAEVGGVYISEFEKNSKGFINFKKGARFKRVK